MFGFYCAPCYCFPKSIGGRPNANILGYEIVLGFWSNIFLFYYRLNIQIKICAEYRDMLPRPRLVCQEPGLRPIGRSSGVPDKSSRAYSIHFPIFFSFLCGFGWELCRTASMHSALCHCPLLSEWGWSSDNQSSQHALLRCSWPIKILSGI